MERDRAMATNNSRSVCRRIRSLEVKGGSLDEMRIEFDDNLNCLIGGRGTGKTTVIEFIRYALDRMPDRDLSPSQYRSMLNLISQNGLSLLLRLIVAHLIADFLFQMECWVEFPRWEG